MAIVGVGGLVGVGGSSGKICFGYAQNEIPGGDSGGH